VLRSVLKDRNVDFQWEDTHPLISRGVVIFEPKCGTIGPSEYALITVLIAGNCNPTIINNLFELRLRDAPLVKVSQYLLISMSPVFILRQIAAGFADTECDGHAQG
jgi:hypothetical protein